VGAGSAGTARGGCEADMATFRVGVSHEVPAVISYN
jgi:hypothetical protein